MGTWGAGLFEDDTACDVRDEYEDLIAEGLTSEAATAKLEASFEPASDPYDLEPTFWLALAAAQWRVGRLTERARARALDVLDTGRGLEGFDATPALAARRRRHLDKLRGQLLGPPRPVRRVAVTVKATNDWPIGAILTYERSATQRCGLRVVGHHEDRGGRYAIVEVLDLRGGNLPSELSLAFTPPARDPDGRRAELILLADVAASDRIASTPRGRSPIARLMRALRNNPNERAGDVRRSVAEVRNFDRLLADLLDGRAD